MAQSQQIYNAIREFDRRRPGFVDLMKERATYPRGSEVSILAASASSVRGPHVPTLRLDEVDEIDDEIRDAAAGMCMQTGRERASVSMTSTWHKVGGPMQGLKDASADPKSGIVSHTFCMFEVLERCPESRSGQHLEKCPECPIVKWCHDTNGDTPKAKRSNGHYAIDALIQKTALVSPMAFESDYLSMGPRAAGLWFKDFDPDGPHKTIDAEYDRSLPVHLSIDSGVVTGAVFFQIRYDVCGRSRVNVFADYLREGLAAADVASELIELARTRCLGSLDRVSTDSAGGARNPVGPSVIAEYEGAGLLGKWGLERWPVGSVADSLALLESFIRSADGSVSLIVHPRCQDLLSAMRNYRRAKRAGQWMDYPQDPQHPAEDLVDALRGGLRTEFPDGRVMPIQTVGTSGKPYASLHARRY